MRAAGACIVSSVTDWQGRKVGLGGGLSSAQATASDRGSEWGDVVDELVAMAAAGRRRYVTGARWHEGALVMMARQTQNPALLWRYGDG